MLIVETGQMVAGAESYVTVAEALTYHDNRDNSAWLSATTKAQEAALRKGTAHVDDAYRHRWKGKRVQATVQPLEWPRYGVRMDGAAASPSFAVIPGFYELLSTTLIPQKLKDAVCEAALRALSGPLLADLDQTVAREKTGTMETWYTTGAEVATTYPAIDALLSGLIRPTGMGELSRG